MIDEKVLLLILVFSIIIFHFFFRWFDEKRIQDEREKLIHLRALEITHEMTTWAFSILTLAWVFVFYTQLDSIYFIVVMFATWALSYPMAKTYLRRKM
jgi:hypothetical protein